MCRATRKPMLLCQQINLFFHPWTSTTPKILAKKSHCNTNKSRLVTNSILVCWLQTLQDQLKELCDYKNTIKACFSCTSCCPGTFAPSQPHLMVSLLFLSSSGSNTCGEDECTWRAPCQLKNPCRLWDWDELVAKREQFAFWWGVNDLLSSQWLSTKSNQRKLS